MGLPPSKSKKRSSVPKPWPPKLTFFVDRSFGKNVLCERLRLHGLKVIAHDDRFRNNCPDQEWLGVAGEKRWVVLTRDKAIQRHLQERRVLQAAKVRCFVLTSTGQLKGEQMADIFVKSIRRVIRFAEEEKPPFLAKVYADGSVVLADLRQYRKR